MFRVILKLVRGSRHGADDRYLWRYYMEAGCIPAHRFHHHHGA